MSEYNFKTPNVVIKTEDSIASIVIDGKEINGCISKYTITHEGGGLPILTLEIVGANMTVAGAMIPDLPEIFKNYYKPKRS